ncbi:MAG: hypothetical protein HQK70_11665, partial [Desulfamplus sp.]|nr:hypothetical protein [Desulfamplus sp.]
INTSYVESRNGNYRKDNKCLARKTQCHSKRVDIHDAQINWITVIYNFVYEALNQCDDLVLMTEWKSFRQINFKTLSKLMRQKIR